MTHRCPAPGCGEDVPQNRFACPRHWFALPKDLRDELWFAYRHHGPLSVEHIEAMEACQQFLELAAAT